MKHSQMLLYSGNPREAADQVVALEKAWLDTVWVAEAYGFDSPTLMGYLAAKTETIEIGAAILNIYSRTPGTLIQTAAGLDNVSGGRAIIGLGASGPQVIEGWHGLPYTKPLTRTQEVIDVVRMALRRERLEYDGKTVTLPLPADQGIGLGKPLKMLTKPERPSVPIYVAALGAKSVESTAAIADGWLPFLFVPELHDKVWGDALRAGTAKRSSVPIYVAALGGKSVEQTAAIADGWLPILFVPEKAGSVWGDALAKGAAKRSDDLGTLEIAAGGMCAIGEGPDTKELLEFARPMVALYVGGMGARGKNFYNDLAVRYGYEAEAKEIQDLYLDGKKKEAEAAVPTELLELGNLVGPASYVKERIAAFAEAGVTNLQISPAAADPVALVAQMRELVDA